MAEKSGRERLLAAEGFTVFVHEDRKNSAQKSLPSPFLKSAPKTCQR
jgi:hypothetical protein